MSDRSQPPTRSASRGEIYIVVNDFWSSKDLSAVGNFGFEARNLWSILKQGPYHWHLYQGLLIFDDPCLKITRVRFPERPEGQVLYFELASFENDQQEYVDNVLWSTDPEDADNRWECNRKWVRDILKEFVAGGIVSQEKAEDLLSELEMVSKDIELH
ncbi:hypothetical protein FNAPI_3516 [Fusarium napiforme]|uniref:Uncharacterized protein n=1 Tax=Fusarium napiforme TaxID=42672 RepID=A0A8H5JU62_9HYPO|nr:hypothetical protein FNAPI_3516 [Fusarium napiforme]